MTRRRVAGALAFLAALALAGAAPAALSPQDRADLARIEAYLNGITTLEARFAQVSSDGGYAKGTLHLWRPGRMRLEYDPPVPVLIVADSRFLIYFDKELGQTSYLGLDSTPAGFLIRDRISLDDPRVAIKEFRHVGGGMEVTVARADDPLAGDLTLVFGDKPLVLKKWMVTDAQGIVTTVSLVNPRTGMKLDPGLFRFEAPDMQHQDN
ncbi:MAG: outer membrane lipoprotein carrier protein LolA [Hyphomicrobiales bacterium]|nr:outer membrane lipoprotein carrier protein LolA [Hyphomicrobiales bacterium]